MECAQRRAFAAILAMTLGCLPVGDPEWLVDDSRVLAVRVRVVEAGELAPERVDAIAAGDVAEALPGDRVRVEALVVDGHAGPQTTSAIEWFDCGFLQCGGYVTASQQRVPCAQSPDGPCILGTDNPLDFEIPQPQPFFGSQRQKGVQLIAPVGDDRSLADCIARIARREPVWDCRIFAGELYFGPGYALADLAAEIGGQTNIAPEDYPAEIRAQGPNRAPALDRLILTRTDDGSTVVLATGDEATVRIGESLIVATPDELVGEDYSRLRRVEGELVVEPTTETLLTRWWFSAHVTEQLDLVSRSAVAIVVPDVDTIGVVATVTDDRGAVEWTYARLRVDAG